LEEDNEIQEFDIVIWKKKLHMGT